ncbi:excisionase family DNA-binding protein [Gordonia terrae]|uniref:excisionase family DNA-binding protein n=1 Tax=Gordonia hongkongensis TaxID=1701090 RepID=UPI0022B58D67|nr:excisionase family DNA-binding protein [Gordonia terrae]
MSNRLLKPAEAFERLGVANTKGYAILKSGALRSVKIGRNRRIPEDAIDEFIANALRASQPSQPESGAA